MRLYVVLGAIAAVILPAGTQAATGPFAPAAGVAGSTAVSMNSSAIASWATGYLDYLPGSGVDAEWGVPAKALGKAVGDSFDVVSLGSGGRITLTFSGSIFNGAGADFAVFENGFDDTFLELAKVEVSSNGTDFFRFPSYSFTAQPVGAYGTLDPTMIEGLAGKYRQGFGTPFDLQVLSGMAGLDVNQVRYVRILDVIGDGSQFDDYPAAYGGPHRIYDPYPNYGSAGFDLDAIGVMNFLAAAVTPPVIPPVIVPPVIEPPVIEPPVSIPSPVPEPEQFVLLGAGLAMLTYFVRRRRTGGALPPLSM